ncbi:DUF3450 domain-containing protein [Pelagibaculum spongiae]|nr:DUF3450 domain-containing protein [Pelagibaculum spongiae]
MHHYFDKLLFLLLILPLYGQAETQNTQLLDTPLLDTPLKDALKIQQQTSQAASQSQQVIDKLSDQTKQLLQEYQNSTRYLQSLKVFNDNLQQTINNQQDSVDSLQQQIDSIQQTSIEITPLMLRMIDSLQQFIDIDLPFLGPLRQQRVDQLNQLMTSPDVTTSEKFRKILEAYQIESDYGRNIETYKASLLDQNQQKRTLQFLRIGRIALVYQTLDGKETGHWNSQNKSWQILDNSYRYSVSQGIKMAKKQASVGLIRLPIATAEAIQ